MTSSRLRFLLSVAAAALGCGSPPASQEAPRALARAALAQIEGVIDVAGLEKDVEVLRDHWGVPHIYAQTVEDLFFAQGFVAAQDRLWQMEMWRRIGEGRVAEIVGPEAIPRDRLARLLRYRGDPRPEWASYHPDAKRIVTAFVRGVNAFIEHSRNAPPVEFQLTGIRPEPWTAEVPLLRMAGYPVTYNAYREVELALDVARYGVTEANRRDDPEPRHTLRMPHALDPEGVPRVLLEVLAAGYGDVPRPPVLGRYRAWVESGERARAAAGSNNWVVAGSLTATGRPLLANDPHRAIRLPSLRYLVHLVGPGWNVIGSGEPALPGVAIGHNERIAWGLTLVGIDQQDVFVLEVNPANSSEVRWQGRWEPLHVELDTIRVWNEPPRVVTLKFSRHGPIVYEDTTRHRAYALRSVLTEPGTAAYLGSLWLDQAANWEEFAEAMRAWKVPSENLLYADVDGNIGWHVAGLTPLRAGWAGRLPVPGTGDFSWTGFLPTERLPSEHNPARGFIATANQNILPEGYRPILAFEWEPPWRYQRIVDVLARQIARREPFTIADFQRLQHDVYSARAVETLDALRGWSGHTESIERARQRLLAWDARLLGESAEAALYRAWRDTLDRRALEPDVPRARRDSLAEAALGAAIARLESQRGVEWSAWRWGAMNLQTFEHPLGVTAYGLPAVERGGDGTTLNAHYGERWGGASYRQILDPSDWDRSVATSAPGQSGQPESPHYSDLLPLWDEGRYFPLPFQREAVEANTAHRLLLRPSEPPP